MKPFVIALFVLCGLAAAPKAAFATDYNCETTASGAFSYGPVNYNIYNSSDSAAVGDCQNSVNNLAILLCNGQGTTGVFYIRYVVARWYPPFLDQFVDETVAWQCIDGYPYYA
jgi:hypothetical protein